MRLLKFVCPGEYFLLSAIRNDLLHIVDKEGIDILYISKN